MHFHNLSFDGTFILDALLRAGLDVITDGSPLLPGEMSMIISGMRQFYSITVRWANGKKTEFRDSTKKFPGMSIAKIAKSFQLGETKGEIDYHAHRPVGHVITPEERDYLERDVIILAKAMKMVLAAGMKKLTIASDSLAEYKRIITPKAFTRLFPVFPEMMDAELRRAYRGGFTYADERFKGCRTRSGIVLDVNSLYPSVMRTRLLPYGEPEYVHAKVVPTEERPLTIFSVTFTATLKPGHIPCIQIKSSSQFAPTEYLKVIEEPTTLMVTNVDWDLYNEHYDIEVQERGGGWRFKATKGLFDDYIDKWSKVKENSKGGAREIAKLHLNALYGRFGLNPNATSRHAELVDDKVKLVLEPLEVRAPLYVPMAVFITAYARDLTIRAAQENYDTFAYADTDSLHLLQDEVPTTIEVHPHKLGAWKFEYGFESAYYVRSKFYMERMHDWGYASKLWGDERQKDYVTRIAGVPEIVSSALTFDDLVPGNVLKGKLSKKTVPGGVVLSEVPFELKL